MPRSPLFKRKTHGERPTEVLHRRPRSHLRTYNQPTVWFLWRAHLKVADFCEGSVFGPNFFLDGPLEFLNTVSSNRTILKTRAKNENWKISETANLRCEHYYLAFGYLLFEIEIIRELCSIEVCGRLHSNTQSFNIDRLTTRKGGKSKLYFPILC